MKLIFDGEVYEVLALKGGMIFSYCKEEMQILPKKVFV